MITPLFSAPDDFARRALEQLFPVLDDVMPMNGSQKRDLPMACRDLSAMLTTEREALSRPYWTSPRFTSAYLRYFLPWNLVRLSSLLPGLNLGSIPEEPLILDMGSGPLTLPLALWLSRPDLRSRPVTIVASDTTPHILELGRKIFDGLSSVLTPGSPWTIRTMRASVMQGLHRIHARPGALWMITTGNVLNEMEERRARPGHQMADRMRELLENASAMLCEGGLILSVEPGTRQGGRMLTRLRKCALGGAEETPEYEDLTSFALREEQNCRRFPENEEEEDDLPEFGMFPLFRPLAPCPHTGRCPMLDRRSTAWCHVNAPAEHAPSPLRELSARAGLDKDSVSLSFLLLKKLEEGEELPTGTERPKCRTLRARIVSEAFIVPGYPGRARYACTEAGLGLIPDSAHLPPGALCLCRTTAERDRKSHAIILLLDDGRHTPPSEKKTDAGRPFRTRATDHPRPSRRSEKPQNNPRVSRQPRETSRKEKTSSEKASPGRRKKRIPGRK